MTKLKAKTKPFIPIDWDEVDKRLVAGCLGAAIARELGIHYETLYTRCVREKGMTFTEYSAAKKLKGDNLIQMAQFTKAMKGSDTMLIYLGKVRLDQIEADKRKELAVKEEQLTAFEKVMDQLERLQALNIDDTKIINE